MTARRNSRALLLLLAAGAPAFAQDDAERRDCTEDVMIIFDGSGSMASVGYNEMDVPRIVEAVEAVRRVVPKVTDHRRIGLVTYGPGPKDTCSNIELKVEPAFGTAGAIVSELETIVPDGDTPLTTAVEAAADALNFREKAGTIVLVTDGDETCGGDPCALARKLKADGFALTVHVIGFRARSKFFSWRSQADANVSEIPEMSARCLTAATKGEFITAETTEELVTALHRTLGCPVMTEAPRNRALSAWTREPKARFGDLRPMQR